ncbi:hypothetical protein BB559_003041, partial [Furculomyces boomerangus]
MLAKQQTSKTTNKVGSNTQTKPSNQTNEDESLPHSNSEVNITSTNGAQRGGRANDEHGINNSFSGSSIHNLSNEIFDDDTMDISDVSDSEFSTGYFNFPKPGTNEAPRFNGFHPLEFLQEMKYLGKKNRMTRVQIKLMLPKYCNKEIEMFLRNSPIYKYGTWEQLKTLILNCYGDNKNENISESTLDIILQQKENKDISVFLNEYELVALMAIAKGIISEDKAVGKLANSVLTDDQVSGLYAQGTRRNTNLWCKLTEATAFAQRLLKWNMKGKKKLTTSITMKEHRIQDKTYEKSQLTQKYPTKYRCIYCDSEFHSKARCSFLQQNISDGKVKLDVSGRIMNQNGDIVSPNYGNGGIMKLLKDQSNNNPSLQTNLITRLDEKNISSFMAKRNPSSPLDRQGKSLRPKDDDVNMEGEEYDDLDDVPLAQRIIKNKLVAERLASAESVDLVEKVLNASITLSVRELAHFIAPLRRQLASSFRTKRTPVEGPGIESEYNNTFVESWDGFKISSSKDIGKLNGYLNNYP